MINYLSNSIADLYIKRKIILPDEKEVYKSGLELILNETTTFLLVIVISTLFFKLRYAFEFLIVFCITRIFCGGFHAKTTIVCRMGMITTQLIVFVLSYFCAEKSYFWMCMVTIGACLITLPLIPVKHPNKNLDELTKMKNKKRGITAYVIFFLCSVLMRKYVGRVDGNIVLLSLFAVTAFEIIGTYTNGRRCSYEKNIQQDFKHDC